MSVQGDQTAVAHRGYDPFWTVADGARSLKIGYAAAGAKRRPAVYASGIEHPPRLTGLRVNGMNLRMSRAKVQGAANLDRGRLHRPKGCSVSWSRQITSAIGPDKLKAS